MTTIKKIADAINNAINRVRPPQSTIPAILLVCSAINRPGLSAMELAGRVISKQKKHGLAFGPLPDGAQNGYETVIKVFAEEIVDMFKNKCRVQAATPIGGIMGIGTAQTSSGPAQVTTINANAVKVDGTPT